MLLVKAFLWFSTDEGPSPLLNFENKIENLNKIVDNWQFRRLMLLGKKVVIKSLLASQLVYILTPLPTHQKSLEEVNRILFNFLWDGRGDRIKRSAMINDYDKGGLKMIDIKTFNSSLKAIWVKKYLDSANTGKWKLFFDFYLAKHGGKRLFSGNLNTDDSKYLNIKDEFLQEILHFWAEINFQNTLGDFQNTSLWHNSLIRVGKTPVYFPSWSIRSINQVKDLMDGKSRFLTYAAFNSKYSLSSNFLDYYGLITAVQSVKDKVSSERAATHPNPLDQLLKLNDFSKAVYKLLIQRKTTKPLKSERKWETLCREEENIAIDWEKAYCLAFQATKNSKLRIFQFKLLHRRIATNDFLFKIGISSNNLCSFCNEHEETLKHMFWDCKVSQTFWRTVIDWLTKNINILHPPHFPLSICQGLEAFPNEILVYQALLIARYHIYVCRARGTLPQHEAFIQHLKFAREVGQKKAIKNGELKTFLKKWKILQATEQDLHSVTIS